MTDVMTSPPPATRPAEPSSGSAIEWVRKNLFSSVGNTIQTLLFTGITLGLIRAILGQVFYEDANWASVATNLRLLMMYNYPSDQIVRVWVSAAIILLAAGLSLGAWAVEPGYQVRRLGGHLVGIGIVSLVIRVLLPEHTPGVVATVLVVVGVVSVLLGVGVRRLNGNSDRVIPFGSLIAGICALFVAIVWFVPFGQYGLVDGTLIAESGVTVASSTKVPWTVLMVIVVVSHRIGLIVGRIIGSTMRRALSAFWVVGPAFIIFVVLRDPAFDWAHVWSTDIPMGAAFAIGGAALLYATTAPGRAEIARAVGAVIFAGALFNWVAAFFGWYPMLQKARLSFLLLAVAVLLAPAFAGDRATRRRVATMWIVAIAVIHWLITAINTESTLVITAPPFLGGFVLTVGIAYYVMLASFPLGVLLSLARTSRLPIFRVMSTAYIEVIRGIPLITVLFFFSIMLPLFLPKGMGISDLAAVFAGYTVFSAAYMAENVRGGLQSVRRGQYEAADALGLSAVQRTSLIVLPQALRVSIPNLVGQAIAVFKETSLIAIVGGFDLLRIANSTIPNQPDFLGQKRPGLMFISLLYFVFAYTMSKSSQRLEVRLKDAQAR
ncbi:MAG: amino acid ABC transporter permease [Ilumatobacteraceae bacterium]